MAGEDLRCSNAFYSILPSHDSFNFSNIFVLLYLGVKINDHNPADGRIKNSRKCGSLILHDELHSDEASGVWWLQRLHCGARLPVI